MKKGTKNKKTLSKLIRDFIETAPRNVPVTEKEIMEEVKAVRRKKK